MTDPREPAAGLPSLIRRGRAGDRQALEQLAGTYRGLMYRWALVRTGDEDDAEDATQEALVRLFRGLGRYGGKARFETWLFSVVRSAAADVQRGRARTLRLKGRYAAYGGQKVVVEPAADPECRGE